MKVLIVLLAILSLFACHIEQSEPSGESKRLVSATTRPGQYVEDCSQFLEEVEEEKREKAQEMAKDVLTLADLPIPDKFSVMSVADTKTFTPANPAGSDFDKHVIVSEAASR